MSNHRPLSSYEKRREYRLVLFTLFSWPTFPAFSIQVTPASNLCFAFDLYGLAFRWHLSARTITRTFRGSRNLYQPLGSRDIGAPCHEGWTNWLPSWQQHTFVHMCMYISCILLMSVKKPCVWTELTKIWCDHCKNPKIMSLLQRMAPNIRLYPHLYIMSF